MNILLAGYTGLTGSFVLQQLIEHDRVKAIICVGRTSPTPHKKITFEPWEHITKQSNPLATQIDAVICCIGTTIRKAGSQAAFRAVDLELVITLAQWTKNTSRKFILMSSVGASEGSSNFYLKVKGEAEHAIQSSFGAGAYIVRPSILLGNRKELRIGESIGKIISTVISPLMFGSLRKYKPVKAKDVAQAMVTLAVSNQRNASPFHYDDVMALTQNN